MLPHLETPHLCEKKQCSVIHQFACPMCTLLFDVCFLEFLFTLVWVPPELGGCCLHGVKEPKLNTYSESGFSVLVNEGDRGSSADCDPDRD